MLIAQSKPMIVQLVQTPTPEITLADVIFGSFGLVGVLILAALVFGAGFAMLLVVWNRRHPPETDHMPPVSPLISSSAPPSYRGQ